jgi:HNH endonuclease
VTAIWSAAANRYYPVAEPQERFWPKVCKSDECWEWTGATARGYGRFRLGRRFLTAHRVAYEWLIGPIPEDWQLDHLCRNRACVRPDHLEAVTARENLLRAETSLPAIAAAKTHCPQGHWYGGHNLVITPGRRHCRICRNATSKASRERHRVR